MRALFLAIGLASIAAPAAPQLSNPTSAPVCETAPAPDTLTGTVGIAAPCIPRADAASRTVIQAKNTVTDADGFYRLTFDAPFDRDPIYADARVYGQSQPYLCTVTATTTGASGKCFQLVASTLPAASTALAGLVISPFSSAAANLPVRVVARQ